MQNAQGLITLASTCSCTLFLIAAGLVLNLYKQYIRVFFFGIFICCSNGLLVYCICAAFSQQKQACFCSSVCFLDSTSFSFKRNFCSDSCKSEIGSINNVRYLILGRRWKMKLQIWKKWESDGVCYMHSNDSMLKIPHTYYTCTSITT